MNIKQAKEKLDALINKSRAVLYKPIQIAEILYYQRTIDPTLDLSNVENYRIKSRTWRDKVTIDITGNRCTSSSRFQDNLFEKNAIPPDILVTLGVENIKSNGAVEAYIYNKFGFKRNQLKVALDYVKNASNTNFELRKFIDLFWFENGLRRSIDKIYEIIVYSLFETIINELELSIELRMNKSKLDVLIEFEPLTKAILNIDRNNLNMVESAHVYRVGITNQADRGLDLYGNWGPAIQIKHLALDEELAESIVSSVSSDKVVIVCKEANKKLINSLISQLGWRSKIQSIITEENLIEWYDKIFRGKFSEKLGYLLLNTMIEQIEIEFPSITDRENIIDKRHYELISNDYWK